MVGSFTGDLAGGTNGGTSLLSTAAKAEFQPASAALTNLANGTGLAIGTNSPIYLGKNVVYLRDEFIGGVSSASSANYPSAGDLGWGLIGTATATHPVAEAGRWGVRQMLSVTTSNTSGLYYLGATAAYPSHMPIHSGSWQSTWCFRALVTNGVEHAFGFVANIDGWSDAKRGFFVRYDDVLGDTNWVVITRNASGSTTNWSDVPISTNWISVVFESFDGTPTVSFNGGTRITNAATYFTLAAMPFQAIIPRDGSNAKSNALDYFDFTAYPTR
jgi:hypothetical protein